jgi:Lipocalin-like domain
MKTTLHFFFAAVALFGTYACAQNSAHRHTNPASSDNDRLTGAWRLVSMQEPGPNGTLRTISDRTGTLIYTRDGHMSVQIIYPASEAKTTNDYVLSGYEASFGSYDENEQAHTVTHHVQGSITHGLVGKDLTRVYRLSGSQL